MEEHHFLSVDRKQNARDSVLQPRSNLPDVSLNMVDARLADWARRTGRAPNELIQEAVNKCLDEEGDAHRA